MTNNRVIISKGRHVPCLRNLMGHRLILAHNIPKEPLMEKGVGIGANALVGIHSPPPPVMRFQDNNPAPPMPMRGGALLSSMNFSKRIMKKKDSDLDSNIKVAF